MIARVHTTVVAVVLITLAALLPMTSRALTMECADGSKPTLVTPEIATSLGGTVAVGTNICDSDKKLGFTGDAGAAKQYINSLPKKPLSQCAPPDKPNIDGLNNTFAICAAKFFQDFQKYGGITITSALRSSAPGSARDGSGKDANSCAGGVSGSNHTQGVAMDVYPNSNNWRQLWDFASKNPQYGVCFPFQDQPISGYPNGDKPHMILAGIGGSEGARCAAQGVTKPCNGLPFTPNNPGPGGPVASNGGLVGPTAALANGMRSMMGMPPPPPMMQPQTPQPTPSTPTSIPPGNTTPYTAGTCNPQFFCQGKDIMYRASTCVDKKYQTCPIGCSGQVCTNNSSTSTDDTGSSDSSRPSIADQLLALTNAPGTAVTIGTSTSIALNSDLDNTVVTNTNTNTNVNAPYATGTMAYVQPTYNQNTFVSNDLANSPTVSQYSQQQTSTFQQVLANLKNVLLYILSYLRPFGRSVAAQ